MPGFKPRRRVPARRSGAKKIVRRYAAKRTYRRVPRPMKYNGMHSVKMECQKQILWKDTNTWGGGAPSLRFAVLWGVVQGTAADVLTIADCPEYAAYALRWTAYRVNGCKIVYRSMSDPGSGLGNQTYQLRDLHIASQEDAPQMAQMAIPAMSFKTDYKHTSAFGVQKKYVGVAKYVKRRFQQSWQPFGTNFTSASTLFYGHADGTSVVNNAVMGTMYVTYYISMREPKL